MKREGRQAAESEKGKKKARESKTRKEVNVKYKPKESQRYKNVLCL